MVNCGSADAVLQDKGHRKKSDDQNMDTRKSGPRICLCSLRTDDDLDVDRPHKHCDRERVSGSWCEETMTHKAASVVTGASLLIFERQYLWTKYRHAAEEIEITPIWR